MLEINFRCLDAVGRKTTLLPQVSAVSVALGNFVISVSFSTVVKISSREVTFSKNGGIVFRIRGQPKDKTGLLYDSLIMKLFFAVLNPHASRA